MKKLNPQQENLPPKLANHELVVLAAYLADAQRSPADTEDVAIKANELAPGRFTWVKYKDRISLEAVRKALWDATRSDRGAYLIGSEKVGWRLTKAGFDFAIRYFDAGHAPQQKKLRESQTERTAQTREINRMMNEDAFHKIQMGLTTSITTSEAERFFRIDDYVTGKARTGKIERFRILANGNNALMQAIDLLARLVKKE